MTINGIRKIVKRRYRVSSKYRMQLEFNFAEYLVGKCRFTANDTYEIKTQKISLSNDGVVLSDTIPLSWFTSSVLIPWTKVLGMTITDKMPSIDGVQNTPWSSNLNKQTVDFLYCSLRLNDPFEITIDLPWPKEFTDRVQKKELFDI